ncbi:MAG TPA: diphthine--ammonia ligase [Chitinispirillaceae bacterium]|nr:diphthine--ammonia ligase [Chitinispirillaceae bacterium]
MTEATLNKKAFCSWSGGKDSCLALYRMIQTGYECQALFTMLDETGLQSRSHGLTPEVLSIQAQAMGIPLKTGMTSWGAYEEQFKKLATAFKKDSIMNGVFGDIDLQPHRDWVERVCSETGITPHLPLWNEARRTLVEEFIREGFKACIVVINCSMMSERFLGRVVDQQLIDELEAEGVDACGENGEFHTFVFDGPLFKKKIHYTAGDTIITDNYSCLPIKAFFA